MLSLHADRVAFSYSDAEPILSEVTFHLTAGWVGLVGANGAGKSTLLRLLSGDLAPTEGHIRCEPEWALVQCCPQQVELLTPLIEGLANATDAASRRILGQLRLDPSVLERWATLSPGERKRWQIGAALAAAPDVLLLDEPTNHLDVEARGWLLEALQKFRGIGIIVSHERTALEALTTRTLRVHRGEAQLWTGSYEAARREWEAELEARRDAVRQAQERVRRQKQQLDDIRREQEAASAQINTRRRMRNKYDSDARSLVAYGRVADAEATLGRRVGVQRRQAERAVETLESVEWEKTLGGSIFVDYVRPPQPWLCQIDEASLVVDGRLLLHDVRLAVGRESRIRIEGPNGAGKTTLLRALLERTRVPRERLLYVPQDLTTEESVAALSSVRSLEGTERGRVMSLVAALGVDPGRLLASEVPSPGEARKLLIASGLARHAWALILDEPTNHLDLPSIERIEQALREYPGALLLVTHDEHFAQGCTTERWLVADGRIAIRS